VIGIFGGTFDPIHYGHLRPANEARERLGLAEVRLVPAREPPLRAKPVASAAHRLAMVKLAIQEFPGFRCDERELRREGPSYTVATLDALHDELPGSSLCLLIGSDQFLNFERWHRWQDILGLAHVAVLHRPGSQPDIIPGWARSRVAQRPSELAEVPAGRVAILTVRPQDISATRIREALGRGESVAGLVPEAVLAYILSQQLYGPSDRGA